MAAAGAVFAGLPTLLRASPNEAGAAAQAASPSPDAWLDKLTGKHRCFFDAPLHGDGLPQIHAFNYVTTYKEVYKAAPGEVNAVFSCYGAPGMPATIPLAWNDAMWAKYRVGELLGLKDPSSGQALTRNAFWGPRKGDPVLFGGMFLPAGLENLAKLGVTVLMCNNAFMAWMGWMESKGLGTAATIEQDIRANLNPGVITVPAMVIAIEKAQGRGIAYNRQ
jgi:intracellular sulfur oxidation DsrE/DsrF family protein